MAESSSAPSAFDSATVAQVVLDTPLPQLDHLFEYRIPQALQGCVGAGMRVKAPLGQGARQVEGFVVETRLEPEFEGKLAPLTELMSEARVLTAEQYRLARQVADRQVGTVANVLRLAIPKRSVRLEAQWLSDEAGERRARLDAPEPVESAHEALDYWFGEGAEPLARGNARCSVHPPVGMVGGVPRRFDVLAAIAATRLAAEESVIIAVPDYRDIDLLSQALAERIPASRIRRLDGRLTPKPRYEQYLHALEPIPQVLIGTRSVVYAPAHRLGAILMWNDADESFAEPQSPYAHAREVAMMRAAEEGAALVLAAHVPSLEATRLVESGWMREIYPARGRGPRVLPTDAMLGDSPGRAARIPDAAWRALREGLDEGPVLVQVARAGYRPALACAKCRTQARCRRCGGALTQQTEHGEISCRVCGALETDFHCAECGNTSLRAAAIGHQRTAEELGRAFPQTTLVIADGERQLVHVSERPQLVVATPGAAPAPEGGWRAVLILDVSRMLARESLDAVTDALREWADAAALAADKAPVVVTGALSAPLRALHEWHFAELLREELAARRALEFPPAVRVGTIRGTNAEVAAALATLERDAPQRARVSGPTLDEDAGLQRAVIRFHYRDGETVAKALRTAVITAATSGPRRGPGSRGSQLRVRLDAPDVF